VSYGTSYSTQNRTRDIIQDRTFQLYLSSKAQTPHACRLLGFFLGGDSIAYRASSSGDHRNRKLLRTLLSIFVQRQFLPLMAQLVRSLPCANSTSLLLKNSFAHKRSIYTLSKIAVPVSASISVSLQVRAPDTSTNHSRVPDISQHRRLCTTRQLRSEKSSSPPASSTPTQQASSMASCK
jgi:hypothetical protein